MHEAEAAVEYVPASQLVHVLSDVAPVVELDFPASQFVQVADDKKVVVADDKNFPAWQLAQFRPVKSMLQEVHAQDPVTPPTVPPLMQ